MRPIKNLTLFVLLCVSACSPSPAVSNDPPAVDEIKQAIATACPASWSTCFNNSGDSVPLHYVRTWIAVPGETLGQCCQVDLAARSPHNIQTTFWSSDPNYNYASSSYHITTFKVNVTNFIDIVSNSLGNTHCADPYPPTYCRTIFGSGFTNTYSNGLRFDPYPVVDNARYVKWIYAADNPL